MLNLLIVEDEYMTRTELQYEFDWGSVGFRVCSAVRDGMEALEYIKTNQVDVVLTDISMPRMDGLALIEQIRILGYPIRCVILSGYDNFEFAQKSILYGVSHYLLKPLNDEDLYTLFDRLRGEITTERLESESTSRMKRMIEISHDDMTEKTLQNFLTGKVKETEMTSYLLHAGYFKPKDFFFLVLIDSQEFSPMDLKERLTDFFTEIFHQKCIVLLYNSFCILFFALAPFFCTEPQDQMNSLCSKYKLRGLFSGPHSDFSELPSAYQELMLQEKNRFYMEFGQCYSKFDTEGHAATDHAVNPAGFSNEFCSLIKAGRESELCLSLHRYKRIFLQNMPAHDYTVISFTENYLKVVEGLKNDCLSLEALPFKDIYYNLGVCSCFPDMARVFNEQIMALNYSYHNPQKSSISVIDELKSYIQDHYNEELSLTALAARFYFHPNYLSTFFLKKAGISLPKYIRTMRLKKSRELLASTRQSVADIARIVGFSDYRYFCNSFKHEFQQTPLEYRTNQQLSERKGLK